MVVAVQTETTGQGHSCRARRGQPGLSPPRLAAEPALREEDSNREFKNFRVMGFFFFFFSRFIVLFLENTSFRFTVSFLENKRRQNVKMRLRCEVTVA